MLKWLMEMLRMPHYKAAFILVSRYLVLTLQTQGSASFVKRITKRCGHCRVERLTGSVFGKQPKFNLTLYIRD